MGKKFRQTKLEEYLDYYYRDKISTSELIKKEILTKEKYEEISDLIRQRKFNEIASGIDVFSEVIDVEKDLITYKIKLDHIKEALELNRSLYDKKISKGDIIKCTLEYTILTSSFSICKIEALKTEEEVVLNEFYENMDCKIYKRVDFILNLLGIDGKKLMFREKLTYLVRLIPMVVKNYSLLEFSKHSLGKSTLYKNFEKNCYVADSSVTDANLFFNGSYKTIGIIKDYEVLVLDEIQERQNSDSIFNSIQKFLVNGEVSKETASKSKFNTSIVLLGNAVLNGNIEYEEIFINPKTNIFEKHKILKKELLDRINYALPSWGCRAFSPSFLSIDDENDRLYLQDLCHILRGKKINLDKYLKKHHEDLSSLSERAYKSIKNTMEGFIKLLNLQDDEYEFALYLAVEGRYLVENFIDIMEKKDREHNVLKNILTPSNFKKIICSVENIRGKKILDIGTHEIYYTDVNGMIAIESLDTIGFEEIEIIKKYSKDIEEWEETFKISLEDNDDLDKIETDIKNEHETCIYQEEDINYLYGYQFKDIVDPTVLRTLRIIKDENIICKDTSNSCCKDSILEKKRTYLKCETCGKKYDYKEYREYLKKLI